MIRQIFSFVGLASALVGCSWGRFDELEDETWVVSVERPDNDSSNWAVALAESKAAGSGGKLAVVGSSDALFNELDLLSTGGVEVAPTELDLNRQFGIANLDAQPLFLASPDSDAVSLVTPSGNAIVVVNGEGGQLDAFQIFGRDRPDGAAYMYPPNRDGTGLQAAQIITAQDDILVGAHFADPQLVDGERYPKCNVVDDATPTPQKIAVRALGAYRDAGRTYDDILVWTASGRLFVYDGVVFHGEYNSPTANPDDHPCNMGIVGPLRGSADLGFAPVTGSQILTFETKDGGGTVTGRYAVLQGHTENTDSYLALVDLADLTVIGSPRTEERLRTAAYFEHDGKHYVVAGYPSVVIDGTASGRVQVFELDLATGIVDSPVMTLSDAQPEDQQSFGRALAVMNFNDQPIIAVAADNEVFLYFRTSLYDDRRTK